MSIFLFRLSSHFLSKMVNMNPFSKNGILTKITESLPGGGWITAPIHAAAGNTGHAVQAAVAGFGTMAGLVAGGPVGAAIAGGTSAVLSGVVSEFIDDQGPQKVAEGLVAKTGSAGVDRIFNEWQLDGGKKEEAVRASNAGNAYRAGEVLLEAGQKKIAESTRELSGQAGGRKILKSVHGTYLRAVEPEWRVDLVRTAPREWEHWYIEDWGGQVRRERES